MACPVLKAFSHGGERGPCVGARGPTYPSKECEVGLGEQIATHFLTLFEVVDIGGPDAGVRPDGQAGTDLSVKGSLFMSM